MLGKETYNNHFTAAFFTKSIATVFLLIFINFTFTIQYVNLNNFNLTVNEIVEEEVKEEHKTDLFECLVNDDIVVQFLNVKLKEPILEAIVTEVSTPPPELSLL